MPDLTDLLRQSVTAAATNYEPSAGLPQRIARRTLQLQRRRRSRIVGGVAVLAVAVLAVPVILPSRGRSNSVGVAYEPVNITARQVRVSTTTTTTPIRVLDLQAFIDFGIQERNKALRKLAVALKKRDRDEAAKKRAKAEVLGALAARDASPTKNGSSGAPAVVAGPGGTTGTTTVPSSSTTKKPSSTTTNPPTTTTTAAPPPTTQPTTPIVPLSIVAPPFVCAGAPAVFVATGTGADQVVWSNQQVGALAIFTLTESANITARLELTPGSVSTQSYGVQVTPAGTPPC